MKTGTESSHQPLEAKKPKSRHVNSRYLSPSHDNGSKSPRQASSPLRGQKTSTTRKHRSLEDPGFGKSMWPSSSPSHPKNSGTLGDHLKNDRMKDFLERKKDDISISRQKSSTAVFGRFESDKDKENSKEYYRPVLGGSMRYTGNLTIPGKSTSSRSSSNSLTVSDFVPGRLSVDDNELYGNSKLVMKSQRNSDNFADNHDLESAYSASEFLSPSIVRSPQKSGIDVPSRYLLDVQRTRREITDSGIQKPVSLDGLSPKMKKFTLKNAIKRANSLKGYKSSKSQWALSPGRSGSPPLSVESKERLMSFSSLKPPSSSSRPKGMEKLLNIGLDLLKGKKSSASNGSSCIGSSMNAESIHQLRLFHNRTLQWRYANARANTVNTNINKQVEENLLNAWDGVVKLQQSVLQKRLQFQKEKLQMKLEYILRSQIKLLETWGDTERLHLSAISSLKECLHYVICRVPVIDGAKVDQKSIAIALRNASDIAASTKSALAVFSPSAMKIDVFISQLAQVVAQEKLMLEECLEVLKAISELTIKERSLKCYLIQSNLTGQQLQQQQEISSRFPNSVNKMDLWNDFKCLLH